VIEHSDVYAMEDIRVVEVVGFNVRKIPKDTFDEPGTDGLDPVVGDLYSLTVVSSFGFLILPIFLLEDRLSRFEKNAKVLRSRNGNLMGVWKESCYRRTETLGDAEKCGEMVAV